MARDDAYREAERRIKNAQRTGEEGIELRDVYLTELPTSIGDLTQLLTLDLAENKLTWLPKSLGRLSELQMLCLAGNGLTSLPKSLGNLAQLTVLGLADNQLKSLPEFLGDLTQLCSLDLAENRLTSLPESLGSLTELGSLSLSGNKLRSLPASLGQLSGLTYLGLDDNPLDPDLAAAYERGTGAVLRFLRERSVEEVVLSEAKLVLVGEGEVGKSSLLGALRGDSWVEGRDTTHGVEIKPVRLADPHSGVVVTLNGWDFGGQAVYRPTHQLFFSAPAVYLVVWEPRRGPEQGFVEYWTKLIKRRAYDEGRPADRPRVLVVATHGGPKERQAHFDEEALREQFDEMIDGFYHVDSFTEDGLDLLKDGIARAAVSIPQVGRKVPGSWKRVAESVKKRSEKNAYISYEQFEELCRPENIDRESVALYAHILNELGHVVHYGDDPGLKDIVILKAEWLSKAMSFVLEDRIVTEQNGLIRHSRLVEVWNDPTKPKEERYPPELHAIFLRLMERFDLSYRVVQPVKAGATGEPDTSLIAQLVPGARHPNLAEDWGKEAQRGEFERTQVCRVVDAATGDPAPAEGLMYRLIVRLHRYSVGRDNYEKSRHWQSGLLLDDAYNGRALLEQIGNDIRITARAAYPERFLHMISEEVKWLVEYFWKGLNCQIAIPCNSPCRGLLNIEALIAARREIRHEYPCAVCGKWLDIDSLLAKRAEMPKIEEALARLVEGQSEIKRGMEVGFESVEADLRRLISQADEQFDMLMDTLADEGRDAPRLFSLTPVEPGFWSKPTWVSQKIRLTLWCEHSRLPLPELWGDPKRGVYEFEQPREWLVRVAPFAKFVAGTLSLVLPVAGAAVKWSMDEAAYKTAANGLDLSQKSFSALLGAAGRGGEWLARDDDAKLSDVGGEESAFEAKSEDVNRYGGPRAGREAMLREVQALLKDRDPGFGGMLRVRNKRNQFVWIHPRFEKDFYPDPPVIPPPPAPSEG